MKLNIGPWCYSPGLLSSILAAALIYSFVSLGLWQLDRAEQKRNLFAEFENRQSDVAVNLNEESSHQLSTEELIWRPVQASGEFMEEYQILLDNQVVDTQAGYFVYTPFRLDKTEQAVLVNRGWLVADPDRTVSPALVTAKGTVNIKAVAKEIPKTGLLLKEVEPEQMSNSVYRVQRINIEELSALTKIELLPYITRLEPDSAHGYSRKWRLPGSGESMHYGYAFQWFAFAAALLIIYLLLNIKRKDKTG